MECCEFEPKIQVECALEILRILRGGDAASQKGDLLEHAGCLVGSLGAWLNSQTDPVTYAVAAHGLPCTLDECCDEVEASLTAIDEGSVGARDASISPAMMALLMRLAELLIAKFL